MTREPGARAARQARREGECRLDFLPFVLSLLCRLFCRPSESPILGPLPVFSSCVNVRNKSGRNGEIGGDDEEEEGDGEQGGSKGGKASAPKR